MRWARGRRKDAGKHNHQSQVGESELVEECEAFLSGHYAQHLEHDGRLVPDWAWLNVLAHGSEQDVRDLAAQRWGAADGGLRLAWAFVAQDLLTEAQSRGDEVIELQQSTLVPLEIELAGARSETHWVQVVGTVLTALAEHSHSWSS